LRSISQHQAAAVKRPAQLAQVIRPSAAPLQLI